MRKQFLTPPDVPETVVCRTLIIPNSKFWLGIFNSALLDLTSQWEFEQVNPTDLSIEDTNALCQLIIDDAFNTLICTDNGACLQPDGSRIIRIGASGHYEQLANGAWEAPTDDYEVPPVPTRSEGTASERKCLAAANAENVLAQVYEQASDLILEGIDHGEVLALMLGQLAALLGIWVSLAAGAILGLAAALLTVFLELMEFATADTWDETFSDTLRCVLYECATDTDSVVTFDLQCVYDGLAASFDPFDPDAIYHIRLVNQVAFMLLFIGVDGLNAAGATTEVESADCDECGDHCFVIDFKLTDGSEYGYVSQFGNYSSGEGWEGALAGDEIDVYGYWDFGVDLDTIEIRVTWSKNINTGFNNVTNLRGLYPTATGYATTTFILNSDNPAGVGEHGKSQVVNDLLRGIGIDINSGAGTGEPVTLHSLWVLYRGDIPEGWSDNCEE